jgi:hypothetical protein
MWQQKYKLNATGILAIALNYQVANNHSVSLHGSEK